MSRASRIGKAVFPVAGFGTGILPATKAAPKELLTVVDKPLIQYAVEEAVRAGMRQMIFVTNRRKRAIEDHFDKASELEAALNARKRSELLAELRGLFPPDVSYLFVRQPEPTGLGHAVLCAKSLVGDEPFAVILPDELIDARVPATAQLVETFSRWGKPVIGTMEPGLGAEASLGCVETAALDDGFSRARRIHPASRPGCRGRPLAGRFVLTPEVFDFLATTPPAADGEVDLCEALQAMMSQQPILTREIAGMRFDCGEKLGYLAATLHFGLRHPGLGTRFGALVRAAAMDERAPGGASRGERAAPLHVVAD